MKRIIFDEDHDAFRESVRKFIEAEIQPHHDQWIEEGIVPREAWRKAGQQGFLCFAAPEEFGGAGIDDFRYPVIFAEELARQNCTGPGFGVHSSVVLPYILAHGTDEQKRRWVPDLVAGEKILAIAMTEPSAGSDLAAIRTTAVEDGDHYVVNGQKTFVTNGVSADLVLVAVKTAPDKKAWGISLLVAEKGTEGFTCGKPLPKVGCHAQDTCELFFDNARIPKANLLGAPGQGFYIMVRELEQERLLIAVSGIATARAALDWTIAHCKERTAFGQPIGKFQNSRFKLAEMETEITIGQSFVDRCVMEWNAGTLKPTESAMAKWWVADLQQRVVDQCLQLFGGYGYMSEYPIAQAWVDARWTSIGAGTSELMKEMIGKQMGF
ncbi:MAG: acyl-CoA dehydrogenase family protein [Planctomycetota bacterium]